MGENSEKGNFVIRKSNFLKYWRHPPSQKQVIRIEFGSQNMVTGTKRGLQKWVPEQNMDLKYWYRNRIHILFQYPYLKSTFCSGTIIWSPSSVPVPIFEVHILFRLPYFEGQILFRLPVFEREVAYRYLGKLNICMIKIYF